MAVGGRLRQLGTRRLRSLSAGFRPTAIPDLALWLDAADASTITLDGSNNVSEWRDKSGNARHAAQGTALSRPSYTTSNQINGINTPRFDGTDDRLSVPHNAAISGSNYTIFAVVDNDSTGTAFRAWLEKSLNASPTDRKFFIGTNQDIGSPWSPSNMVVVADGESTSAGGNGIKQQSGASNILPVVVTHQKDGSANAFLWTDGVLRAITPTPNSNNTNTSAFDVGGTSYPWLGKVAEVLYYSRVVTTQERQTVETYLRNKWVSSFSPLSISGLALWLDAADASTITLDGSNNVSEWRDKSGNARHVTQATTTRRPSYPTSVFGSLPAVRTDGVDDLLRTPSISATDFFGAGANQFTVVYIGIRQADTGRTFSHWWGAANERFWFDYDIPSSSTSDGLLQTPITPDYITSAPYIGIAPTITTYSWTNGSAWTLRRNIGGTVGTFNGGTVVGTMSTAGTFCIGSDFPAQGNTPGPYNFGEVLWYNRRLNEDELQQIEAYANAKWFAPIIASMAPSLWLDASDVSTITLDGSNNVSQWNDKSGNARHAVQGTVLNRPGYLTNQLNGLGAVKGNGTSQFLEVASMPTLENGYTVYFVAQSVGAAAESVASMNAGTFSGAMAVGASPGTYYVSQWGAAVTQPAPSLNSNFGYLSKYDGAHPIGNYRIRLSTQAADTTGAMTQNAGTPSAGALRVLRADTQYYSKNLYELIIIPRLTSAAEDAAVKAYITAKWGIAWS